MEKMSHAINNLKDSLTLLKDNYNENTESLNCFANLEIIAKEWGEGFIKQKNYINEELKNFFLYMNKENKSFIKYYEPFKTTRLLEDFEYLNQKLIFLIFNFRKLGKIKNRKI